MTVGIIASIPFWICAVIFAVGIVSCPMLRKPGETVETLVTQSLVCLFVCGGFAAIAALLWHL